MGRDAVYFSSGQRTLGKIAVYFCHIMTPWTASELQWSEFLSIDPEVRVRFLALPDFLRSSGSGTGLIRPREKN
jgi:hypothetical protein